ncbi:hypothetical protein [Calothrix sp. 336/3]|uniref:hypothetical protein n=1 Tax=Calothrix sp. 336/3 TaxID=1337936 RepID=UPI0004E3A406|nr:hypothetical protein [Calothrix sp. 336/3]AKG23876.1 hypothetical protein IJ00_23530 [Calothrix sp. 336/3]
MSSDLMPSPESSNPPTSKEVETDQVVSAKTEMSVVALSTDESVAPSSETSPEENIANRQQPIPPPSEPMQYRAIGLIRGRYLASSEQFTQGVMQTSDGTLLEAVLLGRIMSLVKNHLDLESEHLWVVYPRTRQENDKLHVQIVGVWEPENLAKSSEESEESDLESPTETASANDESETEETSLEDFVPSSEIPDGGFSVRGEVVYQSYDDAHLVVKIRQAARKQDDKPKYFKLKLKGRLDTKAVGKFWDFQVQRDGDALVIDKAEAIAELPRKRRPPQRGGGGGRFQKGGRRPGPGGGKPFPRRSNGEPPRPVKRVGDAPSGDVKPYPKGNAGGSSTPIPKPVKRPKPPQE